MALWQNIAGVMQDLFGLGGPSGVKLKNASGTLLVRNAGDSGYAATIMSAIKLTSGASNGYLAVSDADGDLVWTPPASFLGGTNAELVQEEAFTQATSSPLTLFTPPANARLTQVGVSVTAAAAGGSPTISIGIAATPALYMATNENSLGAINEYIKDLWVDVGASPSAVIATIVPSAQTFTGRIWARYTLPS